MTLDSKNEPRDYFGGDVAPLGSTLGARSFSAAAPKLWNGLPVELRQATSLDSFKSKLKTYLFKKYFDNL